MSHEIARRKDEHIALASSDAVAFRTRTTLLEQVTLIHESLPELAVDEIWDSLMALTDRQRTAIVLRFYEDMPDDRIAEILGCRQSTVRSAIHRGLVTLRRVIHL